MPSPSGQRVSVTPVDLPECLRTGLRRNLVDPPCPGKLYCPKTHDQSQDCRSHPGAQGPQDGLEALRQGSEAREPAAAVSTAIAEALGEALEPNLK